MVHLSKHTKVQKTLCLIVLKTTKKVYFIKKSYFNMSFEMCQAFLDDPLQ